MNQFDEKKYSLKILLRLFLRFFFEIVTLKNPVKWLCVKDYAYSNLADEMFSRENESLKIFCQIKVCQA